MKYLICYFDPTVSKMFVERLNENGEKTIVLSSPYNFVCRDEIVAKTVTAENQDDVEREIDTSIAYHAIEKNPGYKAGDGIYYDQFTSSYKATEYGFVLLDRSIQRIRVIAPIQVSKNKVRAYYVVFPTKSLNIPSYIDIEDSLKKKKIIVIVDKQDIEEQLAKINPSEPRVNRILVSRGKEAVNGYDEYFIPLIKLEKKAGKMLEDGRIDFKELESIIEVKRGQEILRKHPGMKPEDGLDIYGEKVSAVFETKEGFTPGEHVIESLGDRNIYISEIDGSLNVDGKIISVSDTAIIKGNVDYDSGNIDVNSSVHIKGSVLPGFSVRAKGNIVIDKNADDAFLEADGDIIIKQGIAGKGAMKIVAGGRVRAKYILNSDVEAMKEIEVSDSIINSRVFSNDKVSVTDRHGKIIGGETTARHEVVVNVVGVPNENLTKINVGVSLFIEREINEIKKEIDSLKAAIEEIMRKIKTSFGEGLFEDPKKFLSILPPLKKKNCLLLLMELTERNKEMNALNQRRIETESKLKLEREPVVVITETAYPGTVISIKKKRRRIDEKLDNVKFYEDPNDKEIHFTAAI